MALNKMNTSVGFVVLFVLEDSDHEGNDRVVMFMGNDGLPVQEFEKAMKFPSETFANYCANFDHTNIKVMIQRGWKVEVKLYHTSVKIAF